MRSEMKTSNLQPPASNTRGMSQQDAIGSWVSKVECWLFQNLRQCSLVAFAAAVCGWPFRAHADNPNSIIYSKHNLSISSPGTVHATAESDICIFCHTPHFATGEGPLWNHQMSAAVYQPYTSSTMKAAVGQPTGASRLCLSCHDGTVALGSVHSRGSGIAMNSAAMPTGANNLGTDLSADHPVSFVYDHALASADGNLRDPNTLPPEVRLDKSGQLQCTSCHDPHNNQYGDFLVLDNTGSALCLSCHNLAPWSSSSHAISGRALPSALVNLLAVRGGAVSGKASIKSLTVASAGCASCHMSHAAGNKQELMRFNPPEKNCWSCHGPEGPGQYVAAEFNKISTHPITLNPDAHSASENAVNPAVRHVTCSDCHNPHASTRSIGSAKQLSGTLNGVVGVTAGGSVIRAVNHEYELCFRCHGDSSLRGPALVPRQVVQTNTRQEFNPGNSSFHPIEAVGKNPSTPSLLPPWTTAGLMTCGDCHNNDQGPGNGGSGPRGPHGSAYPPLLERRLLLTDGTPYNPDNFALCYKCHSSVVVDSNQSSSWAFHRTHIEDYRATCTTCHDSHAATQPHLINFNTSYVMPFNGVLTYTSTGVNHGTCTLTCHDGNGQNKAHKGLAY
jgi:predicted CXXCH cytochrome family protein